MKIKMKIGVLSIVLVLLLPLLASCADKNSDDVNSAGTMGNASQTQNLSDRERLYIGYFYFKGNEYQLPMSVREFEAIGNFQFMYHQKLGADIISVDLDPGEVHWDMKFYPEGAAWKNDDREAYLHASLKNRTDKEAAIYDVDVVSVNMNEGYVFEDDLELPGGIKIGSSKEEVLAAYGEPDDSKETSLYYYHETEEFGITVYYGTTVTLDNETGLVTWFNVRVGTK